MKSDNKAIATQRKSLARSKTELAFLPAALEIVETPPPPLAGAVSATIIALFCLAVIWACFGQIDIVASATGKIIPSGRTKLVQPFETGVVRAIHVTDGQSVKAGEDLVDLDPTIDDAERKHIESDLLTAQLDIARLTAALSLDKDPLASFHPPEGASPLQISAQRQFLGHQIAEHLAKLADLDKQKAQKEAERDTIEATVNKLEAVLPVLHQRLEIRQVLFAHQTGSKANYLEILQAQVETEQDLPRAKDSSARSRSRDSGYCADASDDPGGI